MQPDKLLLNLKTTTRFSQSSLQKIKSFKQNIIEHEYIGGILQSGHLIWMANGAHIEVFSSKTGNKLAAHSFETGQRQSTTVITCVAEITTSEIYSSLLAIAVHNPLNGGILYIFSVQGARVIHQIDVVDTITSCSFINSSACQQGKLKRFDGCLAIGTNEGKVLLMNLNLSKYQTMIQGRHIDNCISSTCQIVPANLSYEEILAHHKQCDCEKLNFGIQLKILTETSAVVSILSLPPLNTIAVGLKDGRMILYNLVDLEAFHLAYPPEENAPLLKLTYLEPANDPRACVYIWAFHAHSNAPIAVMHSIAFETKSIRNDEYIYENFQSCSPRLTIPIYTKGSSPIACQSISKIISEEEDELLSLCLLGWTTPEANTFILVFDLNQWYKEQMPNICNWKEYPSYLAPFPIEDKEVPLDIWINQRSVATFNSIQRPEEHFYPTSLSFDCLKLTGSMLCYFHWPGLQNKALGKLNELGAFAILEPDECFAAILETSLIPQFTDHNYHLMPSINIKREFLLSMALEYNCIGLLKECARLWANGSHMGNDLTECLTLSTLTDWIWKQATLIKDCCNNLCVPLFDHSGISIDLRSRKILANCSRQLRSLAELLHMILTTCEEYIPDEIFDTLRCQCNSIQMTYEYQDVLQWLLNMGLLPEVTWEQFSRHNSQASLSSTPELLNNVFTPVPYPYHILCDYYTTQRTKFSEMDQQHSMSKPSSCKYLYIDMFIENECNSPHLRSEWKNEQGDSFYPPPSLQAMLRILLTSGIPLENKYILFVYLFLDLNMVLEDERHCQIVQNLIKFPAVFKLNPTSIKTAQAFWNLDHKEYEAAIDELLTSDGLISTWQQELLIETLLIQNQPNLALRVLRAPGPSIKTALQIKTLLSNNLVTEAFELQRSKFDETHLLQFYKGCYEQKKWNYVLGLALTEFEGEVLIKFLRTFNTLVAENLQLIYFLQRDKYINALAYFDTVKYSTYSKEIQRKMENTKDLILSAYQLTLIPSERALSNQFLTIKNRNLHGKESCIDGKPFSSNLNNAVTGANIDVIGGVFHRAVCASKNTSISLQPNIGENSYVPFLSKPEIDYNYFENHDYKPITYLKTHINGTKRRKETVYENGDPEYNQPAKRQRIEPMTLSTLEQSMDKNESTISSLKCKKILSAEEFNTLEKAIEKDCTFQSDEIVNLLSTPIVKSSCLEKQNRVGRAQTPQSILKTRYMDHGSMSSRRSISPAPTVNSARRSVDFDEKSFQLSATHQGISDEYCLTTIPEAINIDNYDELEEKNKFTTACCTIKGRASIHDSCLQSNSSVEFHTPVNTTSSLAMKNVFKEQLNAEMDISNKCYTDTENSLNSTSNIIYTNQSLCDISEENVLRLPSDRSPQTRHQLECNPNKINSISTRRRTISSDEIESTPRRSLRLRESDLESNASTPTQLSTRRSQSTTPTKYNPKKKIKNQLKRKISTASSGHKRSIRSNKNSDSLSDTSSIASHTISDDGYNETSLTRKSSKSKMMRQTSISLSSIAEERQPIGIMPETSVNFDILASNRRLTRLQRATMEKYATENREGQSNLSFFQKVQLKQSNHDNSETDEEDIKSTISKVSKTSKASTTRSHSTTPTKYNPQKQIKNQLERKIPTASSGHKRSIRSNKNSDSLSDTPSIASHTISDETSLTRKSSKSKMLRQASISLSSIAEEGQPIRIMPETSVNFDILASNRRLTRLQRVTVEKYAMENRDKSNHDNSDTDDEDNKSTISKVSKTSKASTTRSHSKKN